MLFDPYPDPDCPRYGYIPLDEEHSGSFDNVLRWIKGAALSSLLNVTFVFGGRSSSLAQEIGLGLSDNIHKLHSLSRDSHTAVDVPLEGVKTYSKALERLEGVERKCMAVYKFGDPDIRELGWTHLALGHAVQKHIADTEWKPSLWGTDAFNLVVDMTGADSTADMAWVAQSLDAILGALGRKEEDPTRIIIIVNENYDNLGIKSAFEKYGNAVFVPKPGSASEHVKHLVSASDLVFCPKLDSEECHIAALAGSRPGFIIRGKEDGFNFCASGGAVCSLVPGDRPITETSIAFVPGISERWNVGRFTGCL